jgi:glutathione-regulated potassium-efflux system ancillary protein KefG
MKKISVLVFHPLLHNSRVNRKLLHALEGMEGVNIRNMYDIYPDFFIDVKREQALLVESDIVIWQHPLYWYSSPSLLKEWIDLVLEHGFAFGRKGHALDGKLVLSAISTGGRKEAYMPEDAVKFSIRQLLAPFELTASLCRMHYLSPFVTHGTHLLDAGSIDRAAADYAKVIEALQKEAYSLEELSKFEYINDIIP